jgi:hypothetical protein
MSTLFSKPVTPAPPPVMPAAPTVSNSQAQTDVAAQQEQMSLQRGRTSTVLTGGSGLANVGNTTKQLLGQ